MPNTILIRRNHCKALDEARQRVEDVARKIQADYKINYAWDGELLRLKRGSLHGEVTVSASEVVFQIHLSDMLSMLKPRIIQQINSYLDQYFGPSSTPR